MNDPVKSTNQCPAEMTRRDLLRVGAIFVAGGILAPLSLAEQTTQPTTGPTTKPTTQPTTRSAVSGGKRGVPWWLGKDYERSRVVQICSKDAVVGGIPNPADIEANLERVIQTLAGTTSPKLGWRKILGNSTKIVVRFDLAGMKKLDTTDAMARSIISQLEQAGYSHKNVALVNVPRYLVGRLETRKPERGWGMHVQVGERFEQIAKYVDEADAIINVPFLMADPIGGMSCALQGFPRTILRHPARYFKDRKEILLPEVFLDTRVSEKTKVNIVNAVRIILRGGADAKVSDIIDAGCLIAGFDPVAVDIKSLDMLLRERRLASIGEKLKVTYLDHTVDLGVGRSQVNKIEHIVLKREEK